MRPSTKGLPRSTSLPNLDGKCDLVTATSFTNGTPYILHEPPEMAYDFVRELGRGKYARTYLVRRRSSGRELACKEILKGETVASFERAQREAEVHSVLSGHPNIAGLIEIWEDRNSFYLFMELCSGGELYHAITARGSLTEWEAALVMKVVLQVLQHCHSNGVIHRDVKPENFMLKSMHGRLEKSNIVGIDFGCSAFAAPGQRLYKVMGSPMYLAPEAVSGLGYDFKADIWSAGVLLFSMLSGLSIFEGESDEQICHSVAHQPIDLESEPWPFVSQGAKDLLARILIRDPEKRITINEALSCSWLHDLTAPSSQPLNLLIATRLRDFARFTPLQCLLLNLAVSCQPASNPRKHLQRLFDELDVDGDGSLTVTELQQGLQDMGESISGQEVKDVLAALDINKTGTIAVTQFLAAACDKRCSGVCSIQDKPALQQCTREGAVDIAALTALLTEVGLAVSAEAVLWMMTAAGLEVKGGQVRLEDLEDHISLCKPSNLQSELDPLSSSPHLLPAGSSQQSSPDEDIVEVSEAEACGPDSGDMEIDDHLPTYGASPPPRCCSPELSHPFFFQRRKDDEKAGGTKSAGPLFPEGNSPPSESAWAKLWSGRSRGRSPDSCAGMSEGSTGAVHKAGPLLGSSPDGSILSSQDAFTSGGVTYWTAREEELADFDREEEAEDSDALFGAALTARAEPD